MLLKSRMPVHLINTNNMQIPLYRIACFMWCAMIIHVCSIMVELHEIQIKVIGSREIDSDWCGHLLSVVQHLSWNMDDTSRSHLDIDDNLLRKRHPIIKKKNLLINKNLIKSRKSFQKSIWIWLISSEKNIKNNQY